MAKRGQKGEDAAVGFLKKQEHEVLTRNYHCYRGEIDIISMDREYVVFTEVRSRSKRSYTSPEESITARKKKRLVNCAKRWIMENDYQGDCRFDVIAISHGEIRHYQNAIQYPDW